MENGIYWLLDFFKSRAGKTVGAALLVLVGILAFKIFQDRKEALESKENGFLPPSQQLKLWDDPENELSEDNDHLAVARPYKKFQPPEQKKFVVVKTPEKETAQPVMFKPSDDFEPLPSLIKSQRVIAPQVKEQNSERAEKAPPVIPQGTLLHCQLVMPVETTAPNTPVVARLTKPLILRGKLIAPSGTQIFGQYRSNKGERVFLGEQWRLIAGHQRQLNLKASAMQKQYDAARNLYGLSDGKLGLEGRIAKTKKPNSDWKAVVGTLASATGKLAQERVRTVLGDQIPLTGRNALLEGSTALIDQRMEQLKAKDCANEPVTGLVAGLEFYLLVEGIEENKKSEVLGHGPPVDRLLQLALEQRLNR